MSWTDPEPEARRPVKYEEVYPKSYGNVEDARRNLGEYFLLYNQERLHQALGYRTPAEVHLGGSGPSRCNNVTGVNKKEKEAKRKKMLLLQNTPLRN